MNRNDFLIVILLSSFLLHCEDSLWAQRPSVDSLSTKKQQAVDGNSNASAFIRLTRDSDGIPDSLQTSITRYQNDDKTLLVDLIGVIHVGEKVYYQKLNRQFQQYDSLLYELVAPPESRVPRPGESVGNSNPVRWIQNSMQRMLGLESQLAHVDYTRNNFVHADLSPMQMKRKMEERGETAWSIGLQAFAEMMNNAQSKRPQEMAGVEDVQSFDDLFNLINNPRKLKVMMATQFASSENLEVGLGQALNQLLITDRNTAAMKVLEREVGRGQKRIGIFYGAAHMPDFDKRLTENLGLKRTKQAWVEAWDLKTPSGNVSATDSLLQTFFKLIEE